MLIPLTVSEQLDRYTCLHTLLWQSADSCVHAFFFFFFTTVLLFVMKSHKVCCIRIRPRLKGTYGGEEETGFFPMIFVDMKIFLWHFFFFRCEYWQGLSFAEYNTIRNMCSLFSCNAHIWKRLYFHFAALISLTVCQASQQSMSR